MSWDIEDRPEVKWMNYEFAKLEAGLEDLADLVRMIASQFRSYADSLSNELGNLKDEYEELANITPRIAEEMAKDWEERHCKDRCGGCDGKDDE